MQAALSSTLLSAASLLHSYTPKRNLPPTLLKEIPSLKKNLPPKETLPTPPSTIQGPLGGLPFLCNFFGSPHWFLSRRIASAARKTAPHYIPSPSGRLRAGTAIGEHSRRRASREGLSTRAAWSPALGRKALSEEMGNPLRAGSPFKRSATQCVLPA